MKNTTEIQLDVYSSVSGVQTETVASGVQRSLLWMTAMKDGNMARLNGKFETLLKLTQISQTNLTEIIENLCKEQRSALVEIYLPPPPLKQVNNLMFRVWYIGGLGLLALGKQVPSSLGPLELSRHTRMTKHSLISILPSAACQMFPWRPFLSSTSRCSRDGIQNKNFESEYWPLLPCWIVCIFPPFNIKRVFCFPQKDTCVCVLHMCFVRKTEKGGWVRLSAGQEQVAGLDESREVYQHPK